MTTPGSARWRHDQATRLLAFGRAGVLPDGSFGWLGDNGVVDSTKPRPLYLTARAAYVFALAHLVGDEPSVRLAEAGMTALTGTYRDADHGGWFAALDERGGVLDRTKMNYVHAHALLASATAFIGGASRADDRFAEAAAVIEAHFWSDDEGCAVENWNADFSELENYRGANSNMHSVEAYLVAGDASGDRRWHERALSIATNLIDGHARRNGWRVPEHFDARWRPIPDYNAERPDDQFRPYGTTPGHSFEWARLLVTLEGSLDEPPAWLLEAARALFDRAVSDAWSGDEQAGLPYTVDASGKPVATAQLHWVVCEAVLAADFLYRRTADQRFGALADVWWRHIDAHFIDHARGGWWPELEQHSGQGPRTWSGKPDLYHSYQALLFPSLPLAPTAAIVCARGGAAEWRSIARRAARLRR